MRWYVIVVVAFAWSVGWFHGEPEHAGRLLRSPVAVAQDDGETTPERGDARPAERSGWVALWNGLRGVETPPEPLPDRLVSCDLGSSRTFMRESRCIVVGRVNEPRWTILD